MLRGLFTGLSLIAFFTITTSNARSGTVRYEFSGNSFRHLAIGDISLPTELAGVKSFTAELVLRDDILDTAINSPHSGTFPGAAPSLKVEYNTGYVVEFLDGHVSQTLFPAEPLKDYGSWWASGLRPAAGTILTHPQVVAANVALSDPPQQSLFQDPNTLSTTLPSANEINNLRWIEVIFREDSSTGYYLRGVISSIKQSPPLGPPVELDSSLPVKGDATKLVAITHGWTRGGGPEQLESTRAWMSEMKESIESSPQIGDDWVVATKDWTQFSGTGPAYMRHSAANWALINARLVGEGYGNAIYESGYEELHLIAHSAGAGLIQSAIDQIREREAEAGVPESERMVIHATFLDAYQGLNASAKEWYGKGANWAENYWVTDLLTGDTTEGAYKHAYNKDISAWYLDDHSDPIDFYTATVAGAITAGEGWQLSRESGSTWRVTDGVLRGPDGYTMGNGYDCAPLQAITYPEIDLMAVDLSDRSSTGFVSLETTFSGSTLMMATRSPVWVILTLEALGPVDFVTFTADFTSSAGARGVLSVSWNDVLIGALDESFAGDAATWTMALGDVFEPGSYELALRLDPYTEISSEIRIRDVALGYSAFQASSVPLPSAVTPAGLFLLFLFLARLWRDRRVH